MENPYIEFINLFKNPEGATAVQLGQMVSSSVLKIGDLQLSGNDIYISSELKQKGLYSGDAVATLPTADGQTFVILCKVERI